MIRSLSAIHRTIPIPSRFGRRIGFARGCACGRRVPRPGRRRYLGDDIDWSMDPLVGLMTFPTAPFQTLAVASLPNQYLAYVHDIAENWMVGRMSNGSVRQVQLRVGRRQDGWAQLYGLEGFEPASLQRFFEQRRAFLLQNQEGNHD